MDDRLEIPDFLRRQQQGVNAMSKDQKEPKAAEDATDAKETRVTEAEFMQACSLIKEVDGQLDDLNDKRNAASDVVRRYLGRKR